VETSVQKEVTVTVEMELMELQIICDMLNSWYREVGSKLPDGPSYEQGELRAQFNDLLERAKR
jgi:hypothetical protein